MKALLSIVKSTFLTFLFLSMFSLAAFAQAVYVDSKRGDDENDGTEKAPFQSIHKAMEVVKSDKNNVYTIKLNPGVHILKSTLQVSTKKEYEGKSIKIRASVMPNDADWTPDKMPSLMYAGTKGSIRSVGLSINQSHVEIAGIRHLGYHNVSTKYFPIFRGNKNYYDLEVKQCLFVSDPQVSVIQIGIFAHGDSTKIRNCIFYKTVNAAIFGPNSGSEPGNSVTNCIMYGARESAVWTVGKDSAFVYENNIVSDCKCVWVYYEDPIYKISNCITVNNQSMQCNSNGPSPVKSQLISDNVTTEGEINLRMVPNVYSEWPKDHLHVYSGLGQNLGAGLFSDEVYDKDNDPVIFYTSMNQLSMPDNDPLVYPNPAEDILYISANTINYKIGNYQISNMMGKIVLEDAFASNEINVSALSAGVYVLMLSSNKGESVSETFIIQ